MMNNIETENAKIINQFYALELSLDATSICMGASLMELFSKPLDGAGDADLECGSDMLSSETSESTGRFHLSQTR